LEPFFQGVGFPFWVSWVAPLAALCCAAVFSFWLIVQRSLVALQSVPRAPDRPRETVVPAKHVPSDSSAIKNHPAHSSPVTKGTNVTSPPCMVPHLPSTGGRGQLRSGMFRRAERRLALRRGSDPFPVQLNDASATGTPYRAHILDRSRSGLCIAVSNPVPAETILTVRSEVYPDTAVWVQIRVRHCRQKDNRWLLGCSFVSDQPWSVLLTFG
jgi:hypothetical protein